MAQITKRQNLRMAKSQGNVQSIVYMFLFERNISDDTIELNKLKKFYLFAKWETFAFILKFLSETRL